MSLNVISFNPNYWSMWSSFSGSGNMETQCNTTQQKEIILFIIETKCKIRACAIKQCQQLFNIFSVTLHQNAFSTNKKSTSLKTCSSWSGWSTRQCLLPFTAVLQWFFSNSGCRSWKITLQNSRGAVHKKSLQELQSSDSNITNIYLTSRLLWDAEAHKVLFIDAISASLISSGGISSKRS